jgi:hypothetical protein
MKKSSIKLGEAQYQALESMTITEMAKMQVSRQLLTLKV